MSSTASGVHGKLRLSLAAKVISSQGVFGRRRKGIGDDIYEVQTVSSPSVVMGSRREDFLTSRRRAYVVCSNTGTEMGAAVGLGAIIYFYILKAD